MPPIRLLIIDNDAGEVEIVRAWLQKDMRVPWLLCHCESVETAVDKAHKSDLVILKPDISKMSSPRVVFKDIDRMVFEVPIIVLSTEGDDDTLSTYVMEQGAADIVVRGQFARLVDAIEFALIRQKISTKTRKDRDQILSDSKEKSDADYQAICSQRKAEKEESTNILSLFMGGYSASSKPSPHEDKES